MKNLLCCGLLLLLIGCATDRAALNPPPEPAASALATPPRMSQAALTRIATNLAMREGYQMGQFQEPRFEWDPRDRLWTVWFVRKLPVIAGGYFTVRVHDNTGEGYFLHRE